MKGELKILRSCLIRDNAIIVDGEMVYARPGSFADFATAAFTARNAAYPKFYKMDNLAKLGLLAAEYLLADQPALLSGSPEKVGLVVGNTNASADTDLRYAAMARQDLASPALFVYTLPNIVVGEICIRHQLKGENTFFVMDNYDIELQTAYTNTLFQNQLVEQCLVGWLEFLGSEYCGFLCLVGPSEQADLPNYTTEKVKHFFTK